MPLSDQSHDEVWPPPIWYHPPAMLDAKRPDPLLVWLIAGYDLLTALLLILDTSVVTHWTFSSRNGFLDFSGLALIYISVGLPLAIFFLIVAWMLPRLILKGRPNAHRNVAELQRSLAWALFWLTTVYVALPTLLVVHHSKYVLMLFATLVHTLLTVAGFAVATYLRSVARPAV